MPNAMLFAAFVVVLGTIAFAGATQHQARDRPAEAGIFGILAGNMAGADRSAQRGIGRREGSGVRPATDAAD